MRYCPAVARQGKSLDTGNRNIIGIGKIDDADHAGHGNGKVLNPQIHRILGLVRFHEQRVPAGIGVAVASDDLAAE